ncbi:MAG: preprotein translocase subunit YajC [Tannerella sp.]|jgi:preprotein translocase subunit YajC|nr:preprotein translocase subunit YajC [Tannerella sp.]
MNLLTILLQTPPAQPQSGMGQYSSILMIVAMIAIFYFLMIRPQQKKQKEIQRTRNAMKNGDKVITAGGIHGIIKDIKETSILVEVDEGIRIRVEKSSVYASPEDIQQK